ncbi:MAG TPA: lysophospholipid acyltransferase family protein [Tepidisphaeraceae bacterium]
MTLLYRIGWLFGRFTFFCTMRLEVIRPEMATRGGAYLLASSHLGNLDPFLLSVVFDRPIDWITRVEFYRLPPIAWMLDRLKTIKVRRFGVPVSAIRTAIARLQAGRLVGICPDGGVCRGRESCLAGGRIKRGVGLIAYRTGAPVLPCAIIGADRLNRVGPWLPFRRARLWVAFGERVIEPRTELDRRAAREQLASKLETEYVKLFQELSRTYGLTEDLLGCSGLP